MQFVSYPVALDGNKLMEEWRGSDGVLSQKKSPYREKNFVAKNVSSLADHRHITLKITTVSLLK